MRRMRAAFKATRRRQRVVQTVCRVAVAWCRRESGAGRRPRPALGRSWPPSPLVLSIKCEWSEPTLPPSVSALPFLTWIVQRSCSRSNHALAADVAEWWRRRRFQAVRGGEPHARGGRRRKLLEGRATAGAQPSAPLSVIFITWTFTPRTSPPACDGGAPPPTVPFAPPACVWGGGGGGRGVKGKDLSGGVGAVERRAVAGPRGRPSSMRCAGRFPRPL